MLPLYPDPGPPFLNLLSHLVKSLTPLPSVASKVVLYDVLSYPVEIPLDEKIVRRKESRPTPRM